MKRIFSPALMKCLFSAMFLLFLLCAVRGQKQSEVFVIYDINSKTVPAGSIIIPFDKRFTVIVPAFNTQNIKTIYAYQAEFYNESIKPKLDKGRTAIRDLEFTYSKNSGILTYRTSHDTLAMDFPALKPNIYFELAVVRAFTNNNLQNAYSLNEALYLGNWTDIKDAYTSLYKGTYDHEFGVNYFNYDQDQYRDFYTSRLSGFYVDLHNPVNYQTSPFLETPQVNLIASSFHRHYIKFRDLGRVEGIIVDGSEAAVYNGTKALREDYGAPPPPPADYSTGIGNLATSIAYFRELTDSINQSLSIEEDIALLAVRTRIVAIKQALEKNKKFLASTWKQINDAMQADKNLAEDEMFATTTTVKDIKTQGGNHFTADFGFASIMAPDINNHLVYIPKAFYGVNYYFRPIDKNARSKDFPRKYIKGVDGPDYNIATKRSVWQDLSLSVGLTFGSMSNQQFDNLFNNGVLMVGPAYRLGKFTKVNAGVALLKRDNKNPLISNKTVIAGFYVNLAADLDVIQGVKDFANLIFK